MNRTFIAGLLATIMLTVLIPAGRLAAFTYNESGIIPLPVMIAAWLEGLYTAIIEPINNSHDNVIADIPNYAAQRRKDAANGKIPSKACVKEDKTYGITENLKCCSGLKEITVHGDNGLLSLCVNQSGQKAGGQCTFDGDCRIGMKCQRNDSGKSACIDIKNQKEGAACTFDDDCATGYHCDRTGFDNTCKKTPACAKAGETIDRENEQTCCSGLKMVAGSGLDYKCVVAGNQEETKSCTFDSDCADDYFCYNFYQCREKPACAPAGEVSDYENGKECCSGLESVSNYRIKNGELVLPAAAKSICTKCGDGTCGKGENGPNCAMDCPVESVPEAADDSTEYLQSTAPFGKALLQPGQCQEIDCVGSEREINGIYKCNGKIIGKITCGNDSDSNGSGYGSAEGGFMSGYSCCGKQGSSGGGINGMSANRTSPNIKYEPLDVPAVEKCASEGETLVFFSNQKCCAGLRSIFTKQGGIPVEICIKNRGQRDGDPCDNDEDCRSGLVCSYQSGICSKEH